MAKDQRRLNILAILPEKDPLLRAGQERMTRNLREHDFHLAYGPREAAPYLAKAEVMLCISLADEIARRASELKWIHALVSGVDRIVSLPSLAPGVLITNSRGIHAGSVPEAALAFMLWLTRDISRCVRGQAERRWDPFTPSLLERKTVGILGTGVIGQALARKCQALGMTVVGVSATPRNLPGFDRMRHRSDLVRVVGEFDYFVAVTALTPSTERIVNAHVLKAMKPSAFLINVGRGALVDEPALLTALREGWIAGAGLDCFAHEPLPADSPLWSLKNVAITPHLAGRYEGYMDAALAIFESNLQHYLAGDLAGMVNVVSRPPAVP